MTTERICDQLIIFASAHTTKTTFDVWLSRNFNNAKLALGNDVQMIEQQSTKPQRNQFLLLLGLLVTFFKACVFAKYPKTHETDCLLHTSNAFLKGLYVPFFGCRCYVVCILLLLLLLVIYCLLVYLHILFIIKVPYIIADNGDFR